MTATLVVMYLLGSFLIWHILADDYDTSDAETGRLMEVPLIYVCLLWPLVVVVLLLVCLHDVINENMGK